MNAQAGSTRAVVVLIASKEEWTSRSYESILTPKGYVVHKAYTRRQTLERVKHDTPHVILLDVQLPDGDGHDVCRELRAGRLVTPSTPILLTAAGPPTRRDRMAARLAGAWDRLGPPLDPDELLAIVGTFVQARLDADEARAQGLVDEATGLYNAQGITRRAREMATRAARRRAGIACVLLEPAPAPDAENGTNGIVEHIATTLKNTARRSDAVGRFGPQTFAIFAEDTNGRLARRVAERLADAILAAPSSKASDRPAPPLRLRGGCDGVPDQHSTPVDPLEMIQRAGLALTNARTDPTKGWLREYGDNSNGG